MRLFFGLFALDVYKDALHVASGAWAEKLGSTRAPLGAMATRDIKSIKLSGQSATVQFDSSFAHKAQATETVQLVSDKGAWSVVSYTID